jgi:hypothetical protein
MKKWLLSVLIVFVAFGCFLQAEDVKATTNRPAVYFNLGSIIPISGEYFIPLPHGGFSLDYPLGKNVMISPELNAIFVLYYPAYLAPGVQINFRDKKMFIGGGIVVLTNFERHYYDEHIPMLLKLNIGYIGDRRKFSVYLLTNKNISGGIVIGFTASFRLGNKK